MYIIRVKVKEHYLVFKAKTLKEAVDFIDGHEFRGEITPRFIVDVTYDWNTDEYVRKVVEKEQSYKFNALTDEDKFETLIYTAHEMYNYFGAKDTVYPKKYENMGFCQAGGKRKRRNCRRYPKGVKRIQMLQDVANDQDFDIKGRNWSTQESLVDIGDYYGKYRSTASMRSWKLNKKRHQWQ